MDTSAPSPARWHAPDAVLVALSAVTSVVRVVRLPRRIPTRINPHQRASMHITPHN
ncbi:MULTISPECIES: hypothetical protein [Corynebacterium]|uniref:hypothetical protein n=1 Tax=Corynebacterium TaxID=1716 RepID=UPI0012DF039E|nr:MULTISPECIES: hypothetical protein [Corynebacterium]MCT1548148.1 hypothetical protein [Corynebacterium amycolatum]MDK7199161.1 hypothetical protein [Corynebacterium amycolatum]MDU3109930.1 hypothetical protein [Corynebacterium sp.]